MSAEAQVMHDAAGAGDTAKLMRASQSDREPMEREYPQDVEIAPEFGASRIAPLLRDGAFQPASSNIGSDGFV